LKLAGALQIVSQRKMRYWACQTPTFGFASISRNEILYLASISSFAGACKILARYSPRAERPLYLDQGCGGWSGLMHFKESQFIKATVLAKPGLWVWPATFSFGELHCLRKILNFHRGTLRVQNFRFGSGPAMLLHKKGVT
jgi:hypothetical protein